MTSTKHSIQTPMRRVVVVANKSWEADPLVATMLAERARPRSVKDIHVTAVRHPYLQGWKPSPDPEPKPRVRVMYGLDEVEIWCLQDLMDPKKSSSSSREKARVLPRIMAYGQQPHLVIAMGTAGFPATTPMNGGVVVGSKVFIHDPFSTRKPLPKDHWTHPLVDKVIDSAIPGDLFREIQEDARFPAEGRFLTTPLHPATPPVIVAGNVFASLGIVNITNYDDYIWADHSAVEKFHKAGTPWQIGSIETTHGLIRLAADKSPFLYVSGITDAVGLFDVQVTPRVYAQNFVAAHNAGLVVAWMIPEALEQLPSAPAGGGPS